MMRNWLYVLVLQIVPQFCAHAIPKQIKNTTAEHIKPLAPFYVPNGTVNLALGKPVTSSDEAPVIGALSMITDGDKDASEGSWVELGFGVQWVQIDLGQPSRIFGIHLWHYHGESRVYRDVVVQLSNDRDFATGVRTVFNNDQDNSAGLGTGKDKEFYEWHQGFRIDTRGKNYEGITARYVRLYSKGNTSDPQNQYIEVEVIGKLLKPVPQKPVSIWERIQKGQLKPWIFTDFPPSYEHQYPIALAHPQDRAAQNLPQNFLVPSNATNVAPYERITSSVLKPISGLLNQITWDSFPRHRDGRWVQLAPGLQWVQVKLYRAHNIFAIRLWHYFEDNRTYHDVIVRVADDEKFTQNVRTLFNNDFDNTARLGKGTDKEYQETDAGLLLDTRGNDLRGIVAQHVRFYSRGNTVNAFNHYVSVEIIGTAAPIRPPGRTDLMLWQTQLPRAPYR